MTSDAKTRPVRARYTVCARSRFPVERSFGSRRKAAGVAADAAQLAGVPLVNVRVSRGDVHNERVVTADDVKTSRPSFVLRKAGGTPSQPLILSPHLSPMEAADWETALGWALDLLRKEARS